jgi:hypothetical protein
MSLKIGLNPNVRSVVEELRQNSLYLGTRHSQLSLPNTAITVYPVLAFSALMNFR